MAQSKTTQSEQSELDALKQELEMLKKLIVTGGTNEKDSSDNDRIHSDEYISVMSLCPWGINLTTLPRGQGKIFRFKELGEVKRILYGDLVSILENKPSFFENGYLYILNPKVVRRHGLDATYEQILSKDKLDRVLECGSQASIKLYEGANEKQRNVCNRIIIQKLKDGESLDLNIVSAISRIGGLDLIGIAEESKEAELLEE